MTLLRSKDENKAGAAVFKQGYKLMDTPPVKGGGVSLLLLLMTAGLVTASTEDVGGHTWDFYGWK